MYLKKINLKNKTALVTGAGKGIGKACAIALAEAGANLIIISRTKKDLNKVSKIIRKFRSKCDSYFCDVTNYYKIKVAIVFSLTSCSMFFFLTFVKCSGILLPALLTNISILFCLFIISLI